MIKLVFDATLLQEKGLGAQWVIYIKMGEIRVDYCCNIDSDDPTFFRFALEPQIARYLGNLLSVFADRLDEQKLKERDESIANNSGMLSN